MAGQALTDYLAAQDYARFTALVRRYSHDVISRAANLTIAAEICAKLLRSRADQYLIIPLGADDEAKHFDALLAKSLEFPRQVRYFVWGEDPDNRDACEAETREKWKPFDAAAWDSFVWDYIRFVSKHLQPIEAQVQQIEAWSQSGVLTPPEQSQVLLSTMGQIRETLEAVWAMLSPSAAEERIAPVIASPSPEQDSSAIS